MKVNIVVRGGWILGRMAKEVARNGYKITDKTDPKADINLYFNYALVDDIETKGIKVGYFTHKEPEQLEAWEKAEKLCDAGIYMAKQYQPDCTYTKQIYPTGLNYNGLNSNLKVGIAGRMYKNGRKGEDWIKNLIKIDYTDWFALGDNSWEELGDIQAMKWQSDEQAKKFYEFIDVLVCTSQLEGGPVPIIEAIKCGTPVISTACGNLELWFRNAIIIEDETEMDVELQKMRDAKLERYVLSSHDWNWFTKEHKIFLEQLYNGLSKHKDKSGSGK